jgi:hypothetical protein
MAKRRKNRGNAAKLNKLQQGLTVDQVVNLVDKEYGYKIS